MASIFGGEAFCIVGPLRFERVIHLVCHAILYGGVVLVAAGALSYYAGGARRGARRH